MLRQVALALPVVLGLTSARCETPMPGSPASADLARVLPADTFVQRLPFSAIAGWAEDDHAAAFRAFLETCAPVLDGSAVLRDAIQPPSALVETCRSARSLADSASSDRSIARTFFETHFCALRDSSAW